MNLINHIVEKFSNYSELSSQFENNSPYPILVLDNFLPENLALALSKECDYIPEEHWSTFTRNQSYMQECTNLRVAPIAYEFTNQFQSCIGIEWLSNITNIKGLITDPCISGAGYSKIKTGESLKVHIDFNWNDKLKLHRTLNFIVYLTPEWNENYGGSLDFFDENNETLIQSIPTLFNRAVIWKYHKRGFHGCPTAVKCPPEMVRKSFRLFFYTSNSTYLNDDLPHRSYYWYNKDTKEPYDIKEKK